MRRIPIRAIAPLIRTAGQNWLDDRAPRLGAALAYYLALSLAPTLVILLAIASAAFGTNAAEGRLMLEMQGLVGVEGAKVIQAAIEGAHRPKSGLLTILLGLVPLFVGSTSAVSELKDALNTIWKVPADDRCGAARNFLNLVMERLLSFALVLGASLFLLVSLFVNTWISGVHLRSMTSPALIQLADWLASFVVITLLFAFIFKALPKVVLTWGDVAWGAVLTSLLFTVGKFSLGVYLGRAGFTDTYGAAASLVILLVWVYYSAQVLFFGAEFTRVYTLQFGSMFVSKLEPRIRNSVVVLVP